MSKETVIQIGRAIEEAQRAKDLKEQQETAKRQAESLRRVAEDQALIARKQAKLRATGVVELFEELRDSKVLTMSKTGDPAIIEWGFAPSPYSSFPYLAPPPYFYNTCFTDFDRVSIVFDEYTYSDWDGTTTRWNGEWYAPAVTERKSAKNLTAKIERSGELAVIGQHIMKPGEKLGDVIRDEILKLKGLKE